MLKKLTAYLSALLLLLLPLAGTVSAVTQNTNPIANPSLEAGSSTPDEWQTGNWGTNTANFEYVNEGHDGSKSVKVTVSDYVDGDAKWFFNPISTSVLQTGKQYSFSAWYKTNVTPKVVAMYLDAGGNAKYFGMPNPIPGADAATTWQQYNGTFSVPQDATSVSVFMFIDQNGWLQTDDYSIQGYTPTGWNSPLLTLTFDDGHEDNVNTALPVMNEYGYKSTQCYATSFIEGVTGADDNVKAFHDAGHEICSHTVNHPMLTTLNDSDLAYELQHSKQYLESVTGESVTDFASPYGDYDARVNAAIEAAGYNSHRSVDEGYNSKDNFDPYRIRVQNILSTTTTDEVNAWVTQAKADNTWLVLVYHRVVDTAKSGETGYQAPGDYDTTQDSFAQHLAAIQQSGITVKTYKDALTDVQSQLNPAPVDTTAPIVSNLATQNVTTTSLEVGFTTDELTTATVEYGLTCSYGNSVQDTNANTSHIIKLNDLQINTLYCMHVVVEDASGNRTTTDNLTARTLAPTDTKPAVVNDLLIKPLKGGATVTVDFSADVLTTSMFEYGESDYRDVSLDDGSAVIKYHHYDLTGLKPGTEYHYKITVTTEGGMSSWYYGEFTTAVADNGETDDPVSSGGSGSEEVTAEGNSSTSSASTTTPSVTSQSASTASTESSDSEDSAVAGDSTVAAEENSDTAKDDSSSKSDSKKSDTTEKAVNEESKSSKKWLWLVILAGAFAVYGVALYRMRSNKSKKSKAEKSDASKPTATEKAQSDDSKDDK